jgi:hypothetical protein
MAAPAASLARPRGSDGIGAHGGSFALVVAVDSWLADEAGSTGAASSPGGAASAGGTSGEPGPGGPPKLAEAPGSVGGVGAAANPDDADPVKPEDADPANPDIAEPVKPEDAEPVKPEDADPADPDIAEPVKLDDPVKPGEDDPPKPEDPVKPVEADPPKVGDADPPKVGEADLGMAGLSGAGMNPVGWSSGAASASGAWPPATAGARGAVGAPFFTVPFLALPFLAGPFFAGPFFTAPFFAGPFLAVPGLRAGTWVAARTSASRADRACRRRHARTAKINPSRSRNTTPAMAASMASLLLMFRWIGPPCVAGREGGDWAAPEAAVLGTASAMPAAFVSALAASTLPKPEPARRPPCRYTVPVVSARVTWAGVRSGNWARMSATMPATIALAALVL